MTAPTHLRVGVLAAAALGALAEARAQAPAPKPAAGSPRPAARPPAAPGRPASRPPAAPGRPAARPPAAPVARPALPGPASKVRPRDRASFEAPVPGSAWAALGLDRRFLKVGDAWRIAWSSRKRYSILKRTLTPEERRRNQWGAPIFVDYRVNKVTNQRIGGRARTVATITAIYASGVRGRLQTGNEIKVDQYFNPVERCVYTKWLVHGRCRDRDTRAVIRSIGAIPLFIGDLERTPAARAPSPTLVEPLRRFAAKAAGGAAYVHVPVRAGRRTYAESWWAPGNLVPTFVVGRNLQGVLVAQRKVR